MSLPIKKHKRDVRKRRTARKVPIDFLKAGYPKWRVSDSWDTYEHWDSTAESSGRELKEMTITDEAGTKAWIMFRNTKEFLEIYSIDVRPKFTGFGTKIMTVLKKYADSQNKGLVLTKVKNEEYFNKFSWLKRRDPVLENGEKLSEMTGWAEYVYGPVPEDAIDYSWIFDEG